MKLPRDVSGEFLARRLERLGYQVTRTRGSHLRLTTVQHGEHHVTIPAHSTLRVGLLAAVIGEVAQHFGLTREQVLDVLFEQ